MLNRVNKLWNTKIFTECVYFRYNLPNKIKDGTYIINLYDYSDTGTHGVALYLNNTEDSWRIYRYSSVFLVKLDLSRNQRFGQCESV